YALFPHLSVAGNVAFPLRQRRIPKSERDALVKAALATVRLDGMESRRPAQLSGGQQQRVALARALVYSPSVLLMDEPLGALDKKLRETLQDEIRRIHSDLGTTFVYVTHDQEEALSLSDRIAVYHDGRVEQVGAGEELYDRPKNLFVARFLGESTLLRGRVDPDAPDVLRVGETGVAVSNPDRITGSARLMLRPERVALESLTDANGHSDGRRLQVRVIDEVYLGHARKLTVELPTGDRGAAREIPDHRSRVRPGESAVMSWQPGSAVLLPEEETSADVSG
ncbi:MAG: ABC transporter ATP-binding protein, partial [Micromonosporaceae bacterium]